MHSLFRSIFALWLVVVGAMPSRPADTIIPAPRSKNFRPLPAFIDNPPKPVTKENIRPGRMLYYDPRLSANQKISCKSCHKHFVRNESASNCRLGSDATDTTSDPRDKQRPAPSIFRTRSHRLAPNVSTDPSVSFCLHLLSTAGCALYRDSFLHGRALANPSNS
jgi:cytochrome c peroxidase